MNEGTSESKGNKRLKVTTKEEIKEPDMSMIYISQPSPLAPTVAFFQERQQLGHRFLKVVAVVV